MRIVGQNAWPVFRGGEKALALILAGLQERGHEVLMVCANGEVAVRCADLGVETEVLKISGDLMVNRALRFSRLLRRYEPDAALLGTFRKVLMAALGARLARVPRVACRVGVSVDVPQSRKYRFVFERLVDVAILNAAEMRPGFLTASPGVDPSRVVAIPTGVRPPPRTRAPEEVRREIGIPRGARVIGSLAYLNPLKRLHRAVDLLARLPEDVHWVHGGEGPERAAVEERAERLGVRERVHILGWRDDVGDLLGLFDLFILTSDREGMSNAMLEALAAGVPVVSTPVSGAAEALRASDVRRRPEEGSDAGVVEDPPGLVVPASPVAMAAAVRSLLDDPVRRARMADAAARRARESFGYERMIEAYEAVLAGEPVPPEPVPSEPVPPEPVPPEPQAAPGGPRAAPGGPGDLPENAPLRSEPGGAGA